MPRVTDGKQAGPGYYEPSPTRVSWRPLSTLLDRAGMWVGVRATHSRRPSTEHVPRIEIQALNRMGVANGLILKLDALEGPLTVTVAARATFPADPRADARLRIMWDHEDVAHRVEAALTPVQFKPPLGSEPAPGRPTIPGYMAKCPHCGKKARMLYWAVTTFACIRCLGIKPETRRLPHQYATMKKVQRALDLFESGGPRTERRRRILRKAWEAQVLLAQRVLTKGSHR